MRCTHIATLVVVIVARSQAEERNYTTPAPKNVLTGSVFKPGHESAHPELCPQQGRRLKLLVLVSSAPDQEAARMAIRLTWAHYARRSEVALAFVLGTAPSQLHDQLVTEDRLYGDVIVGRFLDIYKNLTLKTLSMLEWVLTYCLHVPHVLKVDDDVFINVPRLLEFLASPVRTIARRSIWGHIRQNVGAVRNNASKYFLTIDQYPWRMLPDFTSGPAYVMTRDSVQLLFKAAPAEVYLPLEDVFVTGVLAQKTGIWRRQEPKFKNELLMVDACTVQKGIAIHNVKPKDQFNLWRELIKDQLVCEDSQYYLGWALRYPAMDLM